MKKLETRVGLLLLALHTVASATLRILVLASTGPAGYRLSDLYWALEFWSGTLFDTLFNSSPVVSATDWIYQATGASDPQLVSSLVAGFLILLVGGAFYFAVGYAGTMLVQSVRNRFRRSPTSAPPSREAAMRP